MPIYEYACMECESHFEELVRSSDQAVTCPECGAAKVLKQLSSFAVHGATSKPSFAGPVGRRRRLLRRLLRLRLGERRRDRIRASTYTALSMDAVERAAALRDVRGADGLVHHVRARPQGRTQVVFGSGSPDADLMFVGEAPGFHEDQQGVPFVGQAGKLLDKLLGGIGLTRADVFVANVLKCRPPGNRDPLPEEIAACEPHLFRQIELIEPKLVATLGNFATKLLSGRPAGITRVHGQEQEVTLGARTRAALSALPSGGGALHAVDAEGARGGLRADPGAPRAGGRRTELRSPSPWLRTVEPDPESVQLGLF